MILSDLKFLFQKASFLLDLNHKKYYVKKYTNTLNISRNLHKNKHQENKNLLSLVKGANQLFDSITKLDGKFPSCTNGILVHSYETFTGKSLMNMCAGGSNEDKKKLLNEIGTCLHKISQMMLFNKKEISSLDKRIRNNELKMTAIGLTKKQFWDEDKDVSPILIPVNLVLMGGTAYAALHIGLVASGIGLGLIALELIGLLTYGIYKYLKYKRNKPRLNKNQDLYDIQNVKLQKNLNNKDHLVLNNIELMEEKEKLMAHNRNIKLHFGKGKHMKGVIVFLPSSRNDNDNDINNHSNQHNQLLLSPSHSNHNV